MKEDLLPTNFVLDSPSTEALQTSRVARSALVVRQSLESHGIHVVDGYLSLAEGMSKDEFGENDIDQRPFQFS